jgi:hypothetical protein
VFSIAANNCPFLMGLTIVVNSKSLAASFDIEVKNKEVIPVHKRDLNIRFLAQSPFQFWRAV